MDDDPRILALIVARSLASDAPHWLDSFQFVSLPLPVRVAILFEDDGDDDDEEDDDDDRFLLLERPLLPLLLL